MLSRPEVQETPPSSGVSDDQHKLLFQIDEDTVIKLAGFIQV